MRFPLAIVLSLLVGACTYDPTFGELQCDEEGAVRAGAQCRGGVWIVADVGPDTGGPDEGLTPDASGPDTGPCDAESDTAFCQRLGRDCGAVTANDNCGEPRTAECGVCDEATQTCTDNVCMLIAQTDEELCAAAGATCGSITAEDRTGAMRTVDCGMCTAPLECGIGGTPNSCACENADDAQFCADNGATCGPVTALDPVCGVERTVNCGMCTLPATCGGGGVQGACGCMESDAQFCARLGLNCGPVTADDACGVTRSTTCGTCTLPESCGGGGSQGVCGCTGAAACTALGAQCGSIDVSGVCTNIAAADCGGCGAAGACQPDNTCLCNSGYAYDGASCVDIDECTTPGAAMCDPNATCANTAGSYTCTCVPPYTGNGMTCSVGAPSVAESVIVTAGQADPVATPEITGVDDDLYVMIISMRTSSRTVDSVTGLGLTWSMQVRNCSGDDEETLEIWTARGNTSGNGPVTVNLSGDPWASVIVVYRVTNVPNSGSVGNAVIHNSNGQNGSCSNSTPQSSYSFSYTPMFSNSLLLTGTAIRLRTHSPGAGWTELHEQIADGSTTNDAGLATMSRTNTATTAVTVSGTISAIATNWITGLLEVRGL